MLTSSECTRLQRAKMLATAANVTSQNRTGDYLLEKRFGSGPVIADGVVIKRCCNEPVPSQTADIVITFPSNRSMQRGIGSLTLNGTNYTVNWGDGVIVSYTNNNIFAITDNLKGNNILINGAVTSFTLTGSDAVSCLFLSCPELTNIDCSFNAKLITLEVADVQQLESLICKNTIIRELNLSGKTALKTLVCYHNQLISLIISNCTSLTSIICYSNNLISINLSDCLALETLNCGGNKINSLVVTGLINLKTLFCPQNNILSLNLSGLTKLTTIYCDKNGMNSLIMTGCIALSIFNSLDILYDNPGITLNLTGCTGLTTLDMNGYLLASLNITNCSNLVILNCSACGLSNLDVSGLSKLQTIECANNTLTAIGLSGNTLLNNILCPGNKFIQSTAEILATSIDTNCSTTGALRINPQQDGVTINTTTTAFTTLGWTYS